MNPWLKSGRQSILWASSLWQCLRVSFWFLGHCRGRSINPSGFCVSSTFAIGVIKGGQVEPIAFLLAIPAAGFFSAKTKCEDHREINSDGGGCSGGGGDDKSFSSRDGQSLTDESICDSFLSRKSIVFSLFLKSIILSMSIVVFASTLLGYITTRLSIFTGLK